MWLGYNRPINFKMDKIVVLILLINTSLAIDLHGFSPQVNKSDSFSVPKELIQQYNIIKQAYSELQCKSFKECVHNDIFSKRDFLDDKFQQLINYDKFKRDLKLSYNKNSSSLELPFPPQNYGQYNLPISQKDISQMDVAPHDTDSNILTRDIRIRQGKLRGLRRELKHKELKYVDMFLGIPYAAPPVGALRFMPPGSPPNWPGVRTFDKFSPVCPQNLPDLNHDPLKTMNAGRFNRLKRIIPYLRNQSEDCLYLNIYAPVSGDGRIYSKYPVMVYIHGESFEWNSGNPYDGSILASYGEVVVVTVNFRLGVLGFLRPGVSDYTVSNFGLLDQIAALQWVKDNIGQFGGDAGSVTLMGHGTGAACINFLMVSPVSRGAEGLFHRAVLMSGTALSDWALTINPLQFTIQVAQSLNCPLVEENDELANCLRRKRLSEITSVKIVAPQFRTPLGPLVDGSVVPNTPEQVMGVYNDLFSRYDILYGLTEWEGYHSLNAVSLAYGMLERERDQLLREYMRSRFEVLPDLALSTTLSEYASWRGSSNRPAAEDHRDFVLDVLSDARATAPMIKMGLYHCAVNPKNYMYVFQHNSKFGEFAAMENSIAGEEIAYVFGAPLMLTENALSHHAYSLPEQLLSEAVMTYFTNFAKTGNPNAPKQSGFLTQEAKDWRQYDLDWPDFEARNQSYMTLGIPPTIGNHYRQTMTQFWNKILPDMLANPPSGTKKFQYPQPKEEKTETTEEPNYYKPRAPPRPTSGIYGILKTNPDQIPTFFKKERPGLMDGPLRSTITTTAAPSSETVAGSMALTLVLIIGLCFLFVNIFAFMLLYYKKIKLRAEETRIREINEDLDDGGFEERLKFRNQIYDERKKTEDIYEAVKTKSRERSRKCSTSTVDPNTKVREWIQQEISKYSPSCIRRNETERTKTRLKTNISTDTENTVRRQKKVEKVSVAIDATPATRSASVLKQTPIELTKSLDAGLISAGILKDEDKRTSISMQALPTQEQPVDVNVTSRADDAVTPPLRTIENRNYPKVLPDLPSKRLSLPPSTNPIVLPSQYNTLGRKVPPLPPPRSSTLERKKCEPQRVIDKEPDTIYTNISEISSAEIKFKTPQVKNPPPKILGAKTIIVANKNRPILRREPNIIIKPTIGPKTKKIPQQVLDSKGPSDLVKPVAELAVPDVKTDAVEPITDQPDTDSSSSSQTVGTVRKAKKTVKDVAT